MRLTCFHCSKSVSTEVPDDTVVRAALECPECIEKRESPGEVSNLRIVNALEKLSDACHELDELWDHTGTNMVEGYPLNYSWDEFVAHVDCWLDTQAVLRKVTR